MQYLQDTTLIKYYGLLTKLINLKSELLIINQKEHQFIENKIHSSKIDKSIIKIISLDFKDVPKYLVNIDFGIFKDGFI